MKKNIIFVLLIILTVLSCSKKEEHNSFRIKGSFVQDSLTAKKVVLITQTQEVQDTSLIHSNNFEFKGKVSEPTFAALRIEKKTIKFLLVNDEITFDIKNVDKNNFKIQYKNSKSNERVNSYFKKSEEYIKKYQLLMAQEVNNTNDSIKNAFKLSEDSLAINFLDNLINKYKNLSNKDGLSIIMYDLKGLIGTRNHPEKIETLFNLLPKTEQKGYYGKEINTFLEQSKKIRIGQKINFDFTDINGKSSSINNFHGKLILLEFWASWCGPCIAQIPQLKIISQKQDKVQIISITIDKDLNKWRNKVNDLDMNWINIHYKQQNIDLQKYFFVNGVPYNILLSNDGTVLRKNISMSELLKLLN